MTKLIVALDEPDFDAVASFINPGAGLRHLDLSQDGDYLFDSIFSTETDIPGELESLAISSMGSSSKRTSPILRTYGSDQDM